VSYRGRSIAVVSGDHYLRRDLLRHDGQAVASASFEGTQLHLGPVPRALSTIMIPDMAPGTLASSAISVFTGSPVAPIRGYRRTSRTRGARARPSPDRVASGAQPGQFPARLPPTSILRLERVVDHRTASSLDDNISCVSGEARISDLNAMAAGREREFLERWADAPGLAINQDFPPGTYQELDLPGSCDRGSRRSRRWRCLGRLGRRTGVRSAGWLHGRTPSHR
jgi:hypothetical protein